ncbi:MAG: GNAT family N-acetyltransferase [Bacteroidetes bacterium]|nr:GNAT family N-acetyltransferase [Bacteroidota bacterium]
MQKLIIRPVKFTDAAQLMLWENEPENLIHSERQSPFDFQEILDLIDCSSDFENSKQIRWIIEFASSSIGTLDFFNFQELDNSIEIGILIANKDYRQRGIASQALELGIMEMKKYKIEKFIAKVDVSNKASLGLFEKNSFDKCHSIKKDSTFDLEKNIISYHRCVNL